MDKVEKPESNPAIEPKKEDPRAQAELSDQELDTVVGGTDPVGQIPLIVSFG